MRWLRYLVGMLFGLFSAVVVVSAALVLDSAPPPPPPPKPVTNANFDVAPAPRPAPSRRPPPPPKTPPRAPPPPTAAATSGLSGLAFGLEAFSGLGVDAAAAAGLEGRSVVMTASTVDKPPRPLRRTPPEYPSRARSRGVEGVVRLSLLIGEDGSVQEATVLDASPPETFEAAALAAVRSWKFEPGAYEGAPVKVRVEQELAFRLEAG